jgi:tetratricopeptide (TPR) repeat protein
VIVADAASTDGTAAIAVESGAVAVPFHWEDDFAAGRNFTVGQAASDWILWLNADEELLRASHEELRAALARGDAFAAFVLIGAATGGSDPAGPSEKADLRLFRRQDGLRFVGRCHPRLDPAYVEAAKGRGQRVYPSAVTLRSLAPVDRSPQKLAWNLRLLELELRDRPGQLHYLIEYGRTLVRLQDPRGQAVLADALGQVVAASADPRPPAMNVQYLLEYALAHPTEAAAASLHAEAIRALALRWFPDSPRLLYLNAQHRFDHKDYAGAVTLLERLLWLGRTGGYDRSRTFPRGLVGEDALLNLAACQRCLGNWPQAEACFTALLGSQRYKAEAAQGLEAVRRLRIQGGPARNPLDAPGV